MLKDGVATISAGLSSSACDKHMQDLIWPMIRMNLLYRDKEDIISNGVGDLFLEKSFDLKCNALYTPFSEKMYLYESIPDGKMECYRHLLVETTLNTAKNKENFQDDLAVMRSMYFNAYNIDESQTLDTIVMTQTMEDVFLKSRKHVNFNIYNLNDLQNMFQMNYSNYRIEVVQWEDYSLKEQLKILARTKLLVGLPMDSLKYVTIFMKDDAGIISFCNEANIDISQDWFFRSRIESLSFYKKFCAKNEISFYGSDTVVNVTAIQQNIQSLQLL